MKKKYLIMLAAFMLALPGLAFAGYTVLGNVYVYNGSSYSYMDGSMNVRYNSSAGPAYIMSQEWSDGTVTFYGRDASQNIFFCYIPTTSSLFQRAQLAHYSMNASSYVYVYRTSSSNECTAFSYTSASYYLN
ncbi:MAG: hypothetical protein ACRETO_00150 [Gammaproteobacteria bacterium]